MIQTHSEWLAWRVCIIIFCGYVWQKSSTRTVTHPLKLCVPVHLHSQVTHQPIAFTTDFETNRHSNERREQKIPDYKGKTFPMQTNVMHTRQHHILKYANVTFSRRITTKFWNEIFDWRLLTPNAPNPIQTELCCIMLFVPYNKTSLSLEYELNWYLNTISVCRTRRHQCTFNVWIFFNFPCFDLMRERKVHII